MTDDIPVSEPEVVPTEPESAAPQLAPEPAPAPQPEPSAEADTPIEASAAPTAPAAPATSKRWYVVKVQSGREESIKDAIERKVKIEGLEDFYGQIVIPTETVTELRRGKRVKKEHKLYPGYLMAEVEYNDRILYLFRETSGVGDFVGGTVQRPPPPMTEREVERMLGRKLQKEGEEAEGRVVQIKPRFALGDRLKVTNGTFSGMEGDVKEILEDKSAVRIELSILGRMIPVELEYWQVEPS
jgi:transcriptional antiterminator NusG